MFKTEKIWQGTLVDQLMLPWPWERENLGSNPGYVLFSSPVFIENNHLVGGNITSVAISATAGGNITSVALSDTIDYI